MTYSVYNIKVDNGLYFNPGPTAGYVLGINADGSTSWVQGGSGGGSSSVSSKSFMNTLVGATVPSSTTTYATVGASSINASETNRIFVVPQACTVSRLYTRITTDQVAGTMSTLQFTLRKNNTDTSVTCTIAGGSTAGTISSDLTNSVSFAAGDLMSFKIVNNALSTSATIGNISIQIEI